MSLRVLGVVPARGGSKGIPRKNVAPLAGKPLLAYTAEAALAARHLARVVLSTDDSEIARVGRDCGLEVPFLRPRELAEDTSPTLPVVQHAVRVLEERGDRFDAVCLLQPTSPFRRAEDIDAAIELLERCGADSVVSVSEVPHQYNPHWVYVQDGAGFLRLSDGGGEPISRRQDLPRAFHREGSIYITLRAVLMERNSMYGSKVAGYPMDERESVNIDGPADWERAIALAANR